MLQDKWVGGSGMMNVDTSDVRDLKSTPKLLSGMKYYISIADIVSWLAALASSSRFTAMRR